MSLKECLMEVVGGQDVVFRCGRCGWVPPAESAHRLAYDTEAGSACPSCRSKYWNNGDGWANWRDILYDAIYANMAPREAYDYITSACAHFSFESSPSLVWVTCRQALSEEAKAKRKAREKNRVEPWGSLKERDQKVAIYWEDGKLHEEPFPGPFLPNERSGGGYVKLWRTYRRRSPFTPAPVASPSFGLLRQSLNYAACMQDPIDRAVIRGVRGLPTQKAIAILSRYVEEDMQRGRREFYLKGAVEMTEYFLRGIKHHPVWKKISVATVRKAVKKALEM